MVNLFFRLLLENDSLLSKFQTAETDFNLYKCNMTNELNAVQKHCKDIKKSSKLAEQKLTEVNDDNRELNDYNKTINSEVRGIIWH